MNRTYKLSACTGTAAALLALSGCALGAETPDRFIYEATASSPVGKLTYAESVDGHEPIVVEADMGEEHWLFAPNLNPTTTTPAVTITAPAGVATHCRILQVHENKVTVIDEDEAEDGAGAKCEKRLPEHE